jgi:hypothetical protein
MMKLSPPVICSATITLEKSFLTMAAATDRNTQIGQAKGVLFMTIQ